MTPFNLPYQTIRFWKGTFGLILLCSFAGIAQGAPVWISTIVYSADGNHLASGTGLDITSLPSGKLLGTYISIENQFHSIETSLERWITFPLETPPFYLKEPDISDRKLNVDKFGIAHLFFNKGFPSFGPYTTNFYYGTNSDNTWTLESLIAPFTQAFSGETFALDQENNPHFIFFKSRIGGFIDLIYRWRSGSAWAEETVRTTTGPTVPHRISIDVDRSNTPFIAYGTQDNVGRNRNVQILKKAGASWAVLRAFTEPWGFPTLRCDANDELHLVMLSSFVPPTVRYLRMSGSGDIVPGSDSLYALTNDSLYGTALALDNENHAHIAVGPAYIDTHKNSVIYSTIPFTRVKIAMAQEKIPYLLGNGTNTSSVYVSALLNQPQPTAPQPIARTNHSLSWSWTPPPESSLLGHRLLRLADRADLSGVLGPAIGTFTVTGLSPNTSIGVIVQALFPGLSAEVSSTGTAYTLAAPPNDVGIARPSSKTINLWWTPNGNPDGTVYRVQLNPREGIDLSMETTNQTVLFPLIDSEVPYAVTIASLNNEGILSYVANLSSLSSSGSGTEMVFDLGSGLSVTVRIQGPPSPPELAITVVPATVFPVAPVLTGVYTATGVGFEIPTSQTIPHGQSVTLSLEAPDSLFLVESKALAFARYDAEKNIWIPLVTRASGTDPVTLTAPSTRLGLFQVMVRTSPPSAVADARVYPNPFHPALHNAMSIQEVPTGTHVRILSAGGQLVREFTAGEGNTSWDGRDGEGNPVHSGVYVLQLERNNETRRLRFVLER